MNVIAIAVPMEIAVETSARTVITKRTPTAARAGMPRPVRVEVAPAPLPRPKSPTTRVDATEIATALAVRVMLVAMALVTSAPTNNNCVKKKEDRIEPQECVVVSFFHLHKN